jgi:DNA-binding SARP family transcriptional activator/predicted negative regulator of RcsB-dependent stress response
MLVWHANEVVSVDRLIEALWPGDPPATVRTQMHNLVSSLRRALAAACPPGAAAHQVLVTRSTGYQLCVEPGRSDLGLFHTLAADTRAASASGDHTAAAEGCRRALALWRGRAFEGIASPVLEAEAARLDQELLAVSAEYARALMNLGLHADAAGRLARLVGEHPLHEDLRGLLMLALYRSGRRAQALTVYQHGRRALVDDLGVEPARALSDLHQRILAGDPALDSSTQPPTPTPAGPAQLPADLPDFTGRRAHVKELSALLTGPPGAAGRTAAVISAITGAGGVGKTSLAVHVAHRVRDHFPDGQLYVNLRATDPRPLEPGEVLARFLRDLGMDGGSVPADEDERAARYRSLVAGRRVLVVLDNARDARQIRPLVPGGQGCAVLVTSRRHLPGLPANQVLDLEMLDGAEAQELFARIVGRRRAAAEQDAAAEVVAACAGLPLAIRIAGTRLTSRPGWTVRSLADRLADHQRRLAELDVADLAVRTSFETSYQALPAPAKPDDIDPARAFRLLGLPAAPSISLPAASALLDQPEQHTEAALQMLVDAHLLDEPSAGRYRFHDLLRAYAAERAAAEEAEQARQQALRRLLCWHLHILAAASLVLDPRPRRLEVFDSPATRKVSFATFDLALRWCEAERDNLLASVRQAADCGLHDLANQFAVVLYSYLDLRYHHKDLVSVSQIGLASARILGDQWSEAANLNHLGLAYEELNQLEAATEALSETLPIWGRLGDPVGEASAWGNIGNIHHRAKRYTEALRCFRRTLALARQTGSRSHERTTLGNLGLIHNAVGQFDQAVGLCQQALAMCQDDGDPHGEGFALVALAEAYHGLGRHEEAMARYRQALNINQQIGARLWHGLALLGLGDALREVGRSEEARTSWRDALVILEELGSAQAEEARTKLNQPTSTPVARTL